MTTRRVLPLILGLFFAIAMTGSGQCTAFPVDDGFDPGCCLPAAPNLPAFPSFVTTGEYGALLGCGQTFVVPQFGVWFSAPAYVACDYAIISVFVQLNATHTISGTLLAKYSRSWIDQTSPVIGQVWRFLVNGDLTCAATGGISTCSTIFPRCAALSIPVHFDGHIDYSCDAFIPGGLSISYSLNHHQGCISHAPWSCVPLGGPPGHEEWSYHIVGPAPFTFMPNVAPQGAIIGESVRSSFFRLLGGFQYQCFGEAKIPNVVGSGFLISNPPNCGCGILDQCTGGPINCLVPTANCYAEQLIQGIACCPAPNAPFAGFPVNFIPPITNTGFRSHSIGTWGGGALYPGFSQLTTYWGVVTYTDPCAKANWPIHVVTGVGVSNAFPMGQQFNTSPPTCGPQAQFGSAFIDLRNVLMLQSASLPPGYGCASGSDVVWNITL